MAEFCNQCAADHDFEPDFNNLGPLPSPEHYWPVLCEGCGPTGVDEKGNCLNAHCLHNHGEVK